MHFRIFDHMVGPDLSDHSSDKKRLIEKAVEEYGLKKNECVMIGDTKYDIIGASEAGVDSIAVTELTIEHCAPVLKW